MKVMGYFVDIYGDKTNPKDVFVAIQEFGWNKIEYYAPYGQHGESSVAYLMGCEEITKEEYMEASKNFYTPPEYL